MKGPAAITAGQGVLISTGHLLIEMEVQPSTLATAVESAAHRLSPILMTALKTALGLLPLALGCGEPGREIEGLWRSSSWAG